MAKAKTHQVSHSGSMTMAPLREKARKSVQDIPVKEPRAPMQVLRSTKQWLDQIIDEKRFRTYDEAIMFLITERQRHLSSDFGIFPELPEYVCDGED
jgi:hypothetical protein